MGHAIMELRPLRAPRWWPNRASIALYAEIVREVNGVTGQL